ncbi:Nucleotide-binding universal stress protein, UspA family [Lentzea xinjiangensis]|uniref:Nucleotide-binding universal stress protein, UspA family n=1 Tax=Lentzea xinjiangensis TaxID=402600 RepID=A0A1H9KPI2_9PSEU|nr:universal stress protein [Lentzea xinjiangensis]SER00998.1 Nucleotide-binding universal stress protein, UspA family [Lentzea xinjiangensis]
MSEKPRIVVGIDKSPAARAALSWAVREARRTTTSVLAVSVCRLGFEAAHKEDLRAALDSLGSAADGVEVELRTPHGVPGPVLVELSEHAPCLVVGGTGHHKRDVVVFSSVTAYCLRHALCPVVVVPFDAEQHAGPLMLP